MNAPAPIVATDDTSLTARPLRAVGVDVSDATSIEDAMKRADLDWSIKVLPAENLTILTEDGITPTSIPGQRLVMRSDNHVTLGVVGGRYSAVDNHSVFSIGEHILDQGGVLSRAGSLDHGRKTFMTFDLPGTNVKVGGKDLVSFAVKIVASHDGTGTVNAGLTATRLVCTNGMVAKIKGLPHQFSIRHTASAHSRLQEARTILAGAAQYAKGFAAIADTMLDTPFTTKQFTDYIDSVYPAPDEDQKRATTLWENRRAALLDLFQFAETNDLGRKSAWSAYNSMTEYLDWGANVRGSNLTEGEDVRALRQFEDASQPMRSRAFNDLVAAI